MVLVVLLLGIRASVFSFFLCLLGIMIPFAGVMTGRLTFDLDFNAYAVTPISWVVKIIVFTLFSALTVALLGNMQRWLVQSHEKMTREIEERQRTEEELTASKQQMEALLREVHHRVKSNLQSVTGLLALQEAPLKEVGAADAFRASRDRVRTIARVHEALYQAEDVSHVDFGEFLETLVGDLRSTYGVDPDLVEVELDLDSASLNMDTAIPCGLIVNELLSNSFRFAFQGGRTGWVRVSFKEEGTDSYRVRVADNGSGLPPEINPDKPESLGLRLIHIISNQLRGKVLWDLEQGVSFEMVFKEYEEAGAELY
jgi:two-component sensor histidine kinase